MSHGKTQAALVNGPPPADASVSDNGPTAWTSIRKYLVIGSIAVLAQSGALLLLAEVVRRRRRNHQVIRRLVQRINQAREEEQRHVARELHDNIGQRLSLLSIRLGSMSELSASDALAAAELRDLIREVDDVISEVHNLSHSMHSSKLEYLGLADALAELCRNIARRHHVAIDFQPNEASGDQSPELALSFYRIAQEALNNVVKHSGADRAQVTLTTVGDRLAMQIRDNGIGFDTSVANSGLGLASIEERILSIGGSLSVRSNLNEGTSITVEAPLHPHSHSESDGPQRMPWAASAVPGPCSRAVLMSSNAQASDCDSQQGS
jgi:signal transduction histidine kinase